jgi:uncharacterized protein
MWFAWHIPVKVDTFFYGIGNAIAIFSILMIKFVLLSIIMTFFFNRVGGTTIIAIAMHGLSGASQMCKIILFCSAGILPASIIK